MGAAHVAHGLCVAAQAAACVDVRSTEDAAANHANLQAANSASLLYMSCAPGFQLVCAHAALVRAAA
jgi:hypothetical protein